MKESSNEYIILIAVLTLLIGSSLFFTIGIIAPFTEMLLGKYHILADGLIIIYLYGLFSALFVRVFNYFYPLQSGIFNMNGPQFLHWKIIFVFSHFGISALSPFTPVFARPFLCKLLGAKIGKNVAMGGDISELPLVNIGDSSILGHRSTLAAHALTSGKIILRPIIIGQRVTVGVHCVLMPGVEIGDGSVVTAGSVVKMDTKIPPNELWGGIPARKIKTLEDSDIRG